MNPVLFLFGGRRVTARGARAHELLNLCMRLGVDFDGFRGDGEEISLECGYVAAKKLQRAAEAESLTLSVSELRGLPSVGFFLIRRWGLLLGALCAVLLLCLSQEYVWSVRVTGNQTMTVGEVREELEACGFGVGSRIGQVAMNELENRVLLQSDQLAWITVRMEGTVAVVQVLERATSPEEEPKRPANLVAAKDGQIEGLELFRGECVIKQGQAVRAGELLVSGVYDSQTVGARFTRAAGRVFARTETDFHVEIPLEYTEKVYLNNEKVEIWMNFFQKSMKIFKSTGKTEGACDIIEKENHFSGLGLRDLPVFFTVQTKRYYEERTVARGYEEAEELAYLELERLLAQMPKDTQLLRKEIRVTVTETAVILDCRATCIENIAVQQEFEIAELP
ncbi:MAG: hypothetical protein E7620_08675 [Ruminococcaceae bacterium]|nr:hypothetical protein [Oscillospiraceae bacterium]